MAIAGAPRGYEFAPQFELHPTRGHPRSAPWSARTKPTGASHGTA